MIIDGSLVGYTYSEDLVNRVRLLRRKGLIEKFVNIAMIKGKDE